MATNKYFRIYLQDHLAASTAGLELAKRACASNRDTEFATFMQRLVQEIAEDRAALEEVMDSLEVPKPHLKAGAMWMAEKFGRLKLNGQLTGYSPLSRVIELEGLAVGVRGKRALWAAVKSSAQNDGRIVVDLDRLIERAMRQESDIEEHRLRAAELAFSSTRTDKA